MAQRRPLYEYTGWNMLDALEQRQAEFRRAERHFARAKGRFEAVAAVLAEDRRHWDDKPLAGNVPHLIKELPAWLEAHEEFLAAQVDYMEAKHNKERAAEAINLWQTERADARKA